MKRKIEEEEFNKALSNPENIKIIKSAIKTFIKSHKLNSNTEHYMYYGKNALWKALSYYDINRDEKNRCKFSTYLYTIVLQECKRSIPTLKESRYKTNSAILLEKTPSREKSNGFENKEFINHILSNLKEKEKIMIELRFNEDLTYKEIAEKIKVSPQYVHFSIKKILSNLKRDYAGVI